MIETQDKTVQDRATESGDTSQGGGESDATELDKTVQSDTENDSGGTLESTNIPPELEETKKNLLRDYHKKTQAFSEERGKLNSEIEKFKRDAETLYDLAGRDWFKRALDEEKTRRSGSSVEELSDDEFEAIKNDKRVFREFLTKRDKSISDGLRDEFKTEFNKLSSSQQAILTEKEFDSTANAYGADFLAANKNGELDVYLDKDFDYETAYQLYKQNRGEVAQKTGQRDYAMARKSGIIEKTGLTSTRGGPVFKARNLDEALSRAFDLAKKGVKDYKFTRE